MGKLRLEDYPDKRPPLFVISSEERAKICPTEKPPRKKPPQHDADGNCLYPNFATLAKDRTTLEEDLIACAREIRVIDGVLWLFYYSPPNKGVQWEIQDVGFKWGIIPRPVDRPRAW